MVYTKGLVEKILHREPIKSNRQYNVAEKFFSRDGNNNTTPIGEVTHGDIAKLNCIEGNKNSDKEAFFTRNGYDTTVTLDRSVIQDVIISCKIKRESLCFSRMLSWINYTTNHSREVPNSLMWKGYTSIEL